MSQQFANQAQSALANNYNAGDVSINVVNGAVFPSSGTFTIAMGVPVQFYLQVSNISSNTLTVSSTGQEGTTAVNMAAGTVVTQVVTAGVITGLKNDILTTLITNTNGPYAARSSITGMIAGSRYKCTDSPYEYIYDGVSWQPYIFGYKVVEPILSNFSQVNVGLSTFDTTHGGILWSVSTSSGYNVQFLAASSSLIGTSAYYVDAAFMMTIMGSNGKLGPVMAGGNTTASPFIRSSFGWDSGSTYYFDAQKWNSISSFSSSNAQMQACIVSPLIWLRLYDDGVTNRTTYISGDGYNWNIGLQESRTTFLTPSWAGLAFDTSASAQSTCHCVHFSVHT